MIISDMAQGNRQRDALGQFGGYNHNPSCAESSFYNMQNLSAKHYPFLSPRERRAAVDIGSMENFTVLGMLAKEQLAYVVDTEYPVFEKDTYYVLTDAGQVLLHNRPHDWGHNTTKYYRKNGSAYNRISGTSTPKFFYNGIEISAVSSAIADNGVKGRRQLVSMGANILIFPDGVMWNSLNGDTAEAVTVLEEKTDAMDYPGGSHGRVTADNPIIMRLTNLEGTMEFNQIGATERGNGNTFVQPKTPKKYADDEEVPEGCSSVPPQNGDYWIDTSGDKGVLKLYSDATGNWGSVATCFIKISHSSLQKDGKARFKAGDAVTLGGFVDENYREDTYFNSTFVVQSAGPGWIVVIGMLNNIEMLQYLEQYSYTTTNPPTGEGTVGEIKVYIPDINQYDGDVRTAYVYGSSGWTPVPAADQYRYTRLFKFIRQVPKMDYVVELKNRIWGCRYDHNTNEIYACKLGDPTNWFCYQGIASDSYAVSLGTDGPFTGAVAYNDSAVFFKENAIHKVYGSKPSNYQTQTYTARGIGNGSYLSAVISDETLYYLSKSGVMAYSGGNPVEIGQALGDVRLKDGVGGMLNGKYYLCATDTKTDERALYCFDIETQGWYREDAVDIDFFSNLSENLYAAGENQLAVLNGETYDGVLALDGVENQVEWSGETGDIGLTTPDEKYYSYLQVRIEAPAGSEIRISVQYDSNGRWVEKCVLKPDRKRMYNIPFVTPRCDHMKLKFHGKGDFILYNISKYYDEGGDIYRG